MILFKGVLKHFVDLLEQTILPKIKYSNDEEAKVFTDVV
jgi:hypothetical protein